MSAGFRLAQLRYDAMEPPDDDARDAALAVAEDYDDRATWLDAHGLDLDDELIEAWAEARRAAVVRDGRCWRTLYRSRRFHPLPFGVLR